MVATEAQKSLDTTSGWWRGLQMVTKIQRSIPEGGVLGGKVSGGRAAIKVVR